MPELPEVETVRRGLEKFVVGKQVLNLEILNQNSFAGSHPAKAIAQITAIRRRGKVLIIDLNNDFSLVIHLKMTGQIVFRKNAIVPHKRSVNWGAGHSTNSFVNDLPDKSTRVIFELSDFPKLSDEDLSPSESKTYIPDDTDRFVRKDGSAGLPAYDVFESDGSEKESFGKTFSKLFFNDQRKFGWIKLMPTKEVENIEFLRKMGPEPWDEKIHEKFVHNIRRHQNSMIKPAILDQSVIAGIGNIYADESLWMAKIHPETRVKNLPDEKLEEICVAAAEIMQKSIDSGGSTMKNYIKADGTRGDYLEKFANVFRRDGQPCPRCNTIIQKIRVAGRGTHICPKCQKPDKINR